MDNLRFETSKLKIPFYCIKNEIIDDYCIFVNLTQLFYQFSTISTREPPPQHFLAFYSHIFIEDFISKYHFHLLYSLVFFDYKRQNDRDKKLDQILSFLLAFSLSSFPLFQASSSVLLSFACTFFFQLAFFKFSIFFSQILPNLSILSVRRKTGKMIETNRRYVLAFSSYGPGGHVSCCQLPSGSDSSIC